MSRVPVVLGVAALAGLLAFASANGFGNRDRAEIKDESARDGVGQSLAAPLPTPGPKQVVMSEAEVNERIAAELEKHSDRVPLRQVRVRLRPDGKVDVRGIAEVAGGERDISATLRLQAQEGMAGVIVESLTAGGIPLPAGLANELAARAAAAAGLSGSGLQAITLPPDIAGVEVRDGALIIQQR